MNTMQIQLQKIQIVNCIWNNEELTQLWKESIIVHICKKGCKTKCNDYRYIIISFIQNYLWNLTTYAN
jgi:hypothetical protein